MEKSKARSLLKRTVSAVVMIPVVLGALFYGTPFMNFLVMLIGVLLAWEWIALFSCLWMQFQFYSRIHGCGFDVGRGTPSEETIQRYNKLWWIRWLPNFVFSRDSSTKKVESWSDKLGFIKRVAKWFTSRCLIAEEHRYGFLYDSIWMFTRYTVPLIPIAFIYSSKIMWLGLVVASIYALCWALYEREKYLFTRYKSIASGTNLAEYLTGGFTAIFILFS